jgi:hypothetical protein
VGQQLVEVVASRPPGWPPDTSARDCVTTGPFRSQPVLAVDDGKCLVPPWYGSDDRLSKLAAGCRLRHGDVLVATYIKCGTTWAEQIVLLLLHGPAAVAKLDPTRRNTYQPGQVEVGKIWLERTVEQPQKSWANSLSFADFDAVPGRRVIKTHAQRHMLIGVGPVPSIGTGGDQTALPSGLKVVLVTRNPRDACVSLYHHVPANEEWDFEAWSVAWSAGEVSFGSWHEFHKGWWQSHVASPDQVLWLSYEELKADPLASVRKIALHIGCDEAARDERTLQQVVDLSSFDAMKAQSAAADSSGCGKTAGHLRKGAVGDWRAHFDADSLNAFDASLSDPIVAAEGGQQPSWSVGAGEVFVCGGGSGVM